MSRLQVVHDIPGRLRLRVPAGVDVDPLLPALGASDGVTRCTWSPRTRSLLILYRPDAATGAQIARAAARHVGLDVPAVADVAPPARRTGNEATLGVAVQQAFGDVDHRVRKATKGLVGLAGLLPVTLTAWAIGEVVRGRAAPLAWSSALWYAHGLFRDYSVPAGRD